MVVSAIKGHHGALFAGHQRWQNGPSIYQMVLFLRIYIVLEYSLRPCIGLVCGRYLHFRFLKVKGPWAMDYTRCRARRTRPSAIEAVPYNTIHDIFVQVICRVSGYW